MEIANTVVSIIPVRKEMVQFRYEMGDAPFIYRDAFVMPQAEYDALTPEQITAMQKERYDRWYALVTTIPTEENI